MTELHLPDPSLVVLVGAAGSGKSTFAARHFASDEVLSSDRYRAIVSGDESDQRSTRTAFKLLHAELERRLAAGRLTVVDATNVERSARRALLTRAERAGVPAIAIVFDLPDEVAVARNAARRPRSLDERVVRRHLERLRATPVTGGEGFAGVVVLRDPGGVDELTIERATP